MPILNRIRYSIQRRKRQEMLNRYGFYGTIDTCNDIVVWNSPFGIEVMPDKHPSTDFHIHTMLDCPFLIKPRGKYQTEYSCRLILNSEIYDIELKDLIDLFKESSDAREHTPLEIYRSCECME